MTREPGGTEIGEEIRHLIMHNAKSHVLCAEAELLLFAASRAQLVREIIAPALEAGRIVICDRYLDSTTLFRDDKKRRLFTPEARERMAGSDPRAALAALDRPDLHWLSALQRLDLENYLPLDILTKVDRMSMAASLEARVPLLDHPLVELAARIPPRLQMRRGRGKHLFKRALAGRVPREILERPKRGFAVPLGHWFRGELGGLVREVLLSDAARARGVFRPEYLEELLGRHRDGRPLDLEIWTLLSFEIWCRVFVDRRAGARAPQPSERVRAASARTSGRTLPRAVSA